MAQFFYDSLHILDRRERLGKHLVIRYRHQLKLFSYAACTCDGSCAPDLGTVSFRDCGVVGELTVDLVWQADPW
jgi:hypothetical protein